MNKKAFTIIELLAVVIIIAALIFIMQPFLEVINDRAERIYCSDNLKVIGRSMYIYARDNNGAFPEDLKELYDKEYLSDLNNVDCPRTKTSGTPDSPEYVYTQGLTIESPSQTILVRDADGNHENGRNVLFLDGTVKWQNDKSSDEYSGA